MEVPDLDLSSPDDYIVSFLSLSGKKRSDDSIDLFVFNHDFPFFDMKEVVVGRHYVDSHILVYSHEKKIPVVDLSNCISFHQGLDCSGKLKDSIEESDFAYNYNLMGRFNRIDRFLCSSHYLK